MENNIIKTELGKWKELEWMQGELKELSKESFEKLKLSIKTNGFIQGFNVWEDNSGKLWILDGHHRKRALEELESEGEKIPGKLPLNFIRAKNKKEAAKLVLVYSSTYANITSEGLIEFAEVQGVDIDTIVEEINIDIDVESLEYGGNIDEVTRNINDDESTGNIASVFALKDYAMFPSKNELGMPDLLPEKCVGFPDDITVWNGRFKSAKSEYYLHIHQNKSTVGLNPKKSILAFYTHDAKFEKMWRSPAITTEKMINAGWHAVVGANFSLWGYEPKIMQMIQIFKSRWLARYWQGAGLNVIPDVDWIDEKSFEFCLLGIPKNIPAISIQAQTRLKDEAEKKQRFDGIRAILKEIKPKQLMVYGSKNDTEEIKEIIKEHGVKPIFIKSLLSFTK